MSKTHTPAAEIELGGETRHLVFDLNALAELQEAVAGLNESGASIKILRATLWAALLAETLDEQGNPTERTLSQHQIGRLMKFADVPRIREAIAAAMALATGEDPDPGPFEETSPPAQPIT